MAEQGQADGRVLPSGQQYEITFGEQRAVVTEVGATLRLYEVGDYAVIEGFDEDEGPTGGRGQVLMPWPNRIAGGTYSFGGKQQQLAISEVQTQNASHGLVRWLNWQVVQQEPHQIILGLTIHPQSGYPFTLALTVGYQLGPDGLQVTTTAQNVGTNPLPFGVGYHPYFTVGTALIDQAVLTLPAAQRLVNDERMIPQHAEMVAGTPYDFREARSIGDTVFDACFTDFTRDQAGNTQITLATPDSARSLTLTLPAAFPFVQVYSGHNLPDPLARRRSLAIEPMTCPANAFNSGLGLITLEPGERFTGSWTVTATP